MIPETLLRNELTQGAPALLFFGEVGADRRAAWRAAFMASIAILADMAFGRAIAFPPLLPVRPDLHDPAECEP